MSEKTIKCEVCGGEWIFVGKLRATTPELFAHPYPNLCDLALMGHICEREVNAINSAIVAARQDTRKPEECKHIRQVGASKSEVE